MTDVPVLAEVWRGGRVESVHRGHAVIVDDTGSIVAAWGEPSRTIYPRSSCKILQALPLLESGAGDALSAAQLALACASHSGAAIHTRLVWDWLGDLRLGEGDLRCGAQTPIDPLARHALHAAGNAPCQVHNVCSGKHAGFLTLNRHLGGGAEYVDPDHPVQRAVRAAFEDMIGEDSPGHGIDGCSAPNFACSLLGLGRAMAHLAAPDTLTGKRRTAAERLVAAMAAHPLLVAGEGRACSDLIAATGKGTAVKFGAEGVFIGIVPELRLGIALKIEDGAARASEAVMAALLVRLGLLARDHPAAQARLNAPVRNSRDVLTGHVRAVEALF